MWQCWNVHRPGALGRGQALRWTLSAHLSPNCCPSLLNVPRPRACYFSAAGERFRICRGDFCLATSPYTMANGPLEPSSERYITFVPGALDLLAGGPPRQMVRGHSCLLAMGVGPEGTERDHCAQSGKPEKVEEAMRSKLFITQGHKVGDSQINSNTLIIQSFGTAPQGAPGLMLHLYGPYPLFGLSSFPHNFGGH